MERVSRRFRRVAYERSWFKITCLDFDYSYRDKVAYKINLQFFEHFCKNKLQDDTVKEILKRAKNVKEVFFKFFTPLVQTIEMLPESLKHLPYLWLCDDESYNGKFNRLNSLRLMDCGYDFFKF